MSHSPFPIRDDSPSPKSPSYLSNSPPLSSLLNTDEEQERYLNEEYCIVVDEHDDVIAQGTKKECHEKKNIAAADPSQKSLLHRAFSVFLFNERGELLLQQRAGCKPTFPLHYTNTCCSHPLTISLLNQKISGATEEGAVINECDVTEEEKMKADGVKRAAIRKLEHELGIKRGQIQMEDFHFLTRIYYWAADRHNARWAEHEIDYILFVQKNEKDIQLAPNRSEVDDVRWVSIDYLKAWMYPSSAAAASVSSSSATAASSSYTFPVPPVDTLWTPWFHLMCEKFVFSQWWPTLNAIIRLDGWGDSDSERTQQKKRIYRLTPTPSQIADKDSLNQLVTPLSNQDIPRKHRSRRISADGSKEPSTNSHPSSASAIHSACASTNGSSAASSACSGPASSNGSSLSKNSDESDDS